MGLEDAAEIIDSRALVLTVLLMNAEKGLQDFPGQGITVS
jgi:hypothetical protein